MKKALITLGLCILLTWIPTQRTHAIYWVAVKEVLKKVVKAMDLKVQRLQNKTIWLQNAQKSLENTLSKVQLDEISDWVDKNKEQYARYFEELKAVKDIIRRSRRVQEIITRQVSIVNETQEAYRRAAQDKNFTREERQHIKTVYDGILTGSLQQLEYLEQIISNGKVEMTEGKRLQSIEDISKGIDLMLTDLLQFKRQQVLLSLQRTKGQHEIDQVRRLYNLR